MNPEQLAAHLQTDHYGDFWLTDAVRPAFNLPIVPRQGYRRETFADKKAGFQVPVLVAAVSRENLFDLFLDLLEPLGEVVDVVLETSHESDGQKHLDLFREDIDLPVLKSHCYDFEEMLLNDGCAGMAVLSKAAPIEIQFDEHKLLVIYAQDLEPFEEILKNHDIRPDTNLKLITEGEHLHSTDPAFRGQFDQFCYRLGVGEAVERVSW